MKEIGFECPICGKYYFRDFEGLEECPVCNWAINIVQYDNHDFSEGSNTLSVNEYRIEYAVLSNKSTRKEAEKLKEEFRRKRISMHKEFRELKSGQIAPSCEEMHQQFVDVRLLYVEKLNQLLMISTKSKDVTYAL